MFHISICGTFSSTMSSVGSNRSVNWEMNDQYHLRFDWIANFSLSFFHSLVWVICIAIADHDHFHWLYQRNESYTGSRDFCSSLSPHEIVEIATFSNALTTHLTNPLTSPILTTRNFDFFDKSRNLCSTLSFHEIAEIGTFSTFSWVAVPSPLEGVNKWRFCNLFPMINWCRIIAMYALFSNHISQTKTYIYSVLVCLLHGWYTEELQNELKLQCLSTVAADTD